MQDGRVRELFSGGQGRSQRIVRAIVTKQCCGGGLRYDQAPTNWCKNVPAFQVSTTVSRVQVARSSHAVAKTYEYVRRRKRDDNMTVLRGTDFDEEISAVERYMS